MNKFGKNSPDLITQREAVRKSSVLDAIWEPEPIRVRVDPFWLDRFFNIYVVM